MTGTTTGGGCGERGHGDTGRLFQRDGADRRRSGEAMGGALVAMRIPSDSGCLQLLRQPAEVSLEGLDDSPEIGRREILSQLLGIWGSIALTTARGAFSEVCVKR